MNRWLSFWILVLSLPITLVVIALTCVFAGLGWLGMMYLKLVDEALVENIKK